MPTVYEHACARCGFCCIVERCPVSVSIWGHGEVGEVCPALQFSMLTQPQATCLLADTLPGIGVGCCISARVVVMGRVVDYAEMPAQMKLQLGRLNWEKKIPVVRTNKEGA